MSALEKVLTLTRDQQGYIEKASNKDLDSKTANKGTANYTKYSRDINNAGLMGCQGQPWCCSSQFWIDLKCFGKELALKLWNMTDKTYVGYNCFATYNKFKVAGQVGKEPKVGALVIFIFSHAGRVLNIYTRNGKKYIECAEGNSSSNLKDNNGGMFNIRERGAYDSDIKGYCYINYDDIEPHKTYKISTSKKGLRVTASELNIRNNPGTSNTAVINTYKKNNYVFPTEKTFVNNKPWYKTDKGWISAHYLEGWVKEENNKWWYVKENYTYTINDWQKIDGAWYFFDVEGYMKTGWIEWKNQWYYLDDDGKMVTDTYVKSDSKDVMYYLNKDGIWDKTKDKQC